MGQTFGGFSTLPWADLLPLTSEQQLELWCPPLKKNLKRPLPHLPKGEQIEAERRDFRQLRRFRSDAGIATFLLFTFQKVKLEIDNIYSAWHVYSANSVLVLLALLISLNPNSVPLSRLRIFITACHYERSCLTITFMQVSKGRSFDQRLELEEGLVKRGYIAHLASSFCTTNSPFNRHSFSF